jgi:membrane-associated protease RseP (regulator of RpoE activity)
MKKIRFLLIAIVSTKLWGGDACPMPLNIYNAGVPSWLEEKDVLKGLDFNQPIVGIGTGLFYNKVEIEWVTEGSVADIVDLRVNDVIEKIDGVRVKDQGDISRLVNRKRGGELITFNIVRKKKKLVKAFKLGIKHEDPLIYKLRMYAKGLECVFVASENLIQKEQKKVESKVFEKFKRFDCKHAHKRLKELKIYDFNFDDTAAVLVRGKKRILISFIGEGTRCLDTIDYTGKNLTIKKVENLYNDLFREHIDYRIANP